MNLTLAQQVDRILDDKIARISRDAWAKKNKLPNGMLRKKHVPYTLPAIVDQLVKMRSECADENTTNERLEQIAAFATTGEVRERAFAS